jgi:hypothetical protein
MSESTTEYSSLLEYDTMQIDKQLLMIPRSLPHLQNCSVLVYSEDGDIITTPQSRSFICASLHKSWQLFFLPTCGSMGNGVCTFESMWHVLNECYHQMMVYVLEPLLEGK